MWHGLAVYAVTQTLSLSENLNISSVIESSKKHKYIVVEKVKFHWYIVWVQAQCTQQVCRGANKLCTHLKSWLTCVCREVTMYMPSLPKFRHHWLIVLSHVHLYQVQGYADMLYSRFPPSTTVTNMYLHPDHFILLILCLLGFFYLDMLHTLWMHASSEQFLAS